MRPKHLTLTGGSSTVVYPVDWRQAPQGISIQSVITGTITYAVNYTVADVFNTSLTIPWSPVTASTSANSTATVTGGGITALQFVTTAGTGSVDFYINQATNVEE